jgi:hypothetical protein
MTALSDAAILAAEEAYDTVIRAEGSRSPYLNTRAFCAAFEAASAIEASRAIDSEAGAVGDESATAESRDAQGEGQ